MGFSQFHWAEYCTFCSVVSRYPLSVFITVPCWWLVWLRLRRFPKVLSMRIVFGLSTGQDCRPLPNIGVEYWDRSLIGLAL